MAGGVTAVENVQSIIEILAFFVFTEESAAVCELSNFVWALPQSRPSIIDEGGPVLIMELTPLRLGRQLNPSHHVTLNLPPPCDPPFYTPRYSPSLHRLQLLP